MFLRIEQSFAEKYDFDSSNRKIIFCTSSCIPYCYSDDIKKPRACLKTFLFSRAVYVISFSISTSDTALWIENDNVERNMYFCIFSFIFITDSYSHKILLYTLLLLLIEAFFFFI